MDSFSYLSVLLSIIIGLAITQVLQGLRVLMLSRETARLYAPSLIWAFLLLVIATQMWWSSFGLADHDQMDLRALRADSAADGSLLPRLGPGAARPSSRQYRPGSRLLPQPPLVLRAARSNGGGQHP